MIKPIYINGKLYFQFEDPFQKFMSAYFNQKIKSEAILTMAIKKTIQKNQCIECGVKRSEVPNPDAFIIYETGLCYICTLNKAMGEDQDCEALEILFYFTFFLLRIDTIQSHYSKICDYTFQDYIRDERTWKP